MVISKIITMLNFKFIFVSLFSLFLSSGLYSQITSQKIDRTTNDINQINNDINTLKIFSKRKKINLLNRDIQNQIKEKGIFLNPKKINLQSPFQKTMKMIHCHQSPQQKLCPANQMLLC